MSATTDLEKVRRRRPPRWARPPEARTAAAIISTTGLILLAAACGGSPGSHVAQLGSTATATRSGPSSSTSAGSVQQKAALALSRCMRAHGVSNFPDPDRQGTFPALTQQALGVSKLTSLAAQHACRHLLQSGGSAGTPQQRQQKVAFALKLARCIRRHGFPTFPDPSGSSQGLPAGIDPNSPQFQATEMTCHKQAQQALGLR